MSDKRSSMPDHYRIKPEETSIFITFTEENIKFLPPELFERTYNYFTKRKIENKVTTINLKVSKRVYDYFKAQQRMHEYIGTTAVKPIESEFTIPVIVQEEIKINTDNIEL